jgi:hypothetical protein
LMDGDFEGRSRGEEEGGGDEDHGCGFMR